MFLAKGRQQRLAVPVQPHHRGMRDKPERAGSERRKIVIHYLQMKALDIRNLARNMKGKNLPLAFDGRFRAKGKTFPDQTTLVGTLTVGHHGFPCLELASVYGQPSERLDVFFIEKVGDSEFCYQHSR
ncbi:hypothetical protein JQ605_27930 [Bradyrhizobium sp. AUGA SZCCT0042]|nr:hypothetical protein [Bradyrhizobium sp. AUGA SZCCT0042]MBR1300621.1 hypothetical protein [Bradyrhizobium sp. AUGA SZCCT0042]